MNFSLIISQISLSIISIVAAIVAIAAIKILPAVARWGFNKIITWFTFDSIVQPGLIHPLKPEHEVKSRSLSAVVHPCEVPAFGLPATSSAIVHPVEIPVFGLPAGHSVESNLDSESRFKVFSAIFGFFSDFFGGFFTKFFSFFRRK